MHYDPYYYPYASRRHVVFGSRAMVATSQPLAAQAGLQILQQGGNAVDAAVATAACLSVVEPTGNGIGGDAFAMVWMREELFGLNSSGPAPKLLHHALVKKAGHETMPHDGLLPITVPGIPAAWAALNKRFGALSLETCLAPAIEYAEKGFAVAPITAELWQKAHEHYTNALKNHAAVRTFFEAFTQNGKTPQAGTLWRSPEQAATLRAIAETGSRAFYDGILAEKIDAFMRKEGGFLRGEDLAHFQPRWVDPIKVTYRDHDIWELPPNGHGLVSLMALNILKNFDMTNADSPETMHRLIEAVKLAFVDGLAHIADPAHMRVTVEELLQDDFAAMRAASIGEKALEPLPMTPPKGGTVYLATADAMGNMVSYIQSNYTGFGSGVVIPETGIALQNRGACFSMDTAHPNVVDGGKLPYHTIIPGFITKSSAQAQSHQTCEPLGNMTPFGPFGPFGMMGGFIQPQGHVMLAHRMLDQHLNPQAALDAPRFRWTQGRTVEVEASFPQALASALQRKGHDIRYGTVSDRDFGRGQCIWQKRPTDDDPTRIFMGATEPRTDGQVAAL